MLQTYLTWLNQHQFHGIKPGLSRITKLLKRLGNPHKKYLTIHVAGTNGKGSTCAILSKLLIEHGFKTALYTSPHLIRLNERFKINNLDISDEDLYELLKILYQRVMDEPITYFELTTALAFLYFAEKRVDIAVIETGMGGRLDATNVILPEISVITTIGFDHTKYLGPTLEKIAFEKAGIIKRGRPLVLGRIEKAPLRVITERAEKLSSPSYILDRDFEIFFSAPFWTYRGEREFSNLDLSLKGSFQGDNLALALKTLEILEEKKLIKIEEKKVRSALKRVRWVGRYEKFEFQEKEWLLDSAHNLEGAKALVASLERDGFYPYLLILGITDEEGEKPVSQIFKILTKYASNIFVCEFSSPRKALTLEDWSRILKNETDFRNINLLTSPKEALLKALRSGEKKILLTGSIYFLGEILKSFRELNLCLSEPL